MIRFIVIVRTEAGALAYHAIARHWFDLYSAAINQFGVCAVTG